MQGTIIFLNGTSSSGKTSIAKNFQNSAKELWLWMALDSFLGMFPSDLNRELPPFAQLSRNFYLTAAVWARGGYNVIIDTVYDSGNCVSNSIDALSKFRVYSIGVHCPLEKLAERERIRGDREIGIAQSQLDRVHKYCSYDLELDTSVLSPAECAVKIHALLNALSNPSAFKRVPQNEIP